MLICRLLAQTPHTRVCVCHTYGLTCIFLRPQVGPICEAATVNFLLANLLISRFLAPYLLCFPFCSPLPFYKGKKCRSRDKTPSYRTSKARHQAWLALCLRTKPTVHDCHESYNHWAVAYGNGFFDSHFLPFFCLLLHRLTYSSPRSELLLQPIHETEKCFWLLRVGGFFWWFFFFIQLCIFTCV